MKTHPHDMKARILFNRKIAGPYHRLRLLCPEIARSARPGQFLMLRVRDGRDPLLRRPFSFSRIKPRGGGKSHTEEGEVEIWYKVVGLGTKLMTQLAEGERVDILGPLGNGFWAIEGLKKAILLGGGIGIAPLLSLAEDFYRQRERVKSISILQGLPDVMVLLGGKSREDILGLPELKRMRFHPHIATEDGSLGVKGLATDLLERTILTDGPEHSAVYTCGPWPMLSRVVEMGQQFDLPCQVSLETRMACGLGACLGCAVKLKGTASQEGIDDHAEGGPRDQPQDGKSGPRNQGPAPRADGDEGYRYALTCLEGPVFDGRAISWDTRNL